jgi:xylulokinase
MLAGLGAKLFTSPADAVQHMGHPEKAYTPIDENHQKYQKIYKTLYRDLYNGLNEFNHKLSDIQECLATNKLHA